MAACVAPPPGPGAGASLASAAAQYDTLAAALGVHDPDWGMEAPEAQAPIFGAGDSVPTVATVRLAAESLLSELEADAAGGSDSTLVTLRRELLAGLRAIHSRTTLLSGEGLTIEEAQALHDFEPRSVGIARAVVQTVGQPVVAAPRPSQPHSAPAVAGGLVMPVRGVQAADLVDTYTQSRAAGRSHNAIDIMAPRGTEVQAAAGGHVVRLFASVRGGTTLYQLGEDNRTVYYYAHLDGYAAGVAEGMVVQPGTLIGYVGDTGNAVPGNHHLHFAMWITDDPRRYWDGETLNPYPLLRRDPAP